MIPLNFQIGVAQRNATGEVLHYVTNADSEHFSSLERAVARCRLLQASAKKCIRAPMDDEFAVIETTVTIHHV